MSAVLVMVVVAAMPWAGAVAPVVQRPATLEFHLVDERSNPLQAQQSGKVPSGDKLFKAKDGAPFLLKRETVVTSDEITHVTVSTTQDGPQVDIRLDDRGAAAMLSTTRENLGHQMAAVYEGQVINHAVIRGAFGREFRITGLSAPEADALAMQLARAIK